MQTVIAVLLAPFVRLDPGATASVMKKNRSRIVFLLNSLRVGGSEKKTVNMANALARRGHDVRILYLNDPVTLLPRIDNLVTVLGLERRGKLDRRIVRVLRAYWQTESPDAVWAVNPYPMLYLHLSTRGMATRPRAIVSINTTNFASHKERLQMLLYAPVARRMDTVVFGSEAQRSLWSKRYNLQADRTCVVYNGVDTSVYEPTAFGVDADRFRQAHAITPNEVWVGIVAQFRPEKAHEDLVEAVAALVKQGAPIKLLLVGSGVTQEKIKALVAGHRLENAVLFAGELNDVRIALAAMDIFVLTSRTETFSNAALEAMAMAKPVVLSRVGGAGEMVEDGATGLLYAAGDVQGLQRALSRLLDRELRRQYGGQARALVERRFSYGRMIAAYEGVLAGLDPQDVDMGVNPMSCSRDN